GERRHASEEVSGPRWAVGILDLHVETRESEARANREHHRGDPAEIAERVQAPVIEDKPGRDAEVHEIGKAVEFGAEARRALDHARDAAIDRIEHGGEHDRTERQFVTLLERE